MGWRIVLKIRRLFGKSAALCAALLLAFPIVAADSETVNNLFEAALQSIYPPPAPPPEVAEAICLQCKGTGQVRSRFQNKATPAPQKQTSRYQTRLDKSKDFMVPCNECKGQKRYLRKLTLKERLERFHACRRQYDLEHAKLCHLPFGQAYVALGQLDALDPETFARLAAQFPGLCETCHGFAALPCERCDSFGRIEKANQDQDDVLPDVRIEVCTTCDGKGEKPCKRCDGSGLLKRCRRCKGTGITRKAATKKRPETLERCRSCEGMCRR